jgi:hypothetical protein
VLRAVDVPGVPLIVLSYVEQVEVGPPLAELFCLHGTILLPNGG